MSGSGHTYEEGSILEFYPDPDTNDSGVVLVVTARSFWVVKTELRRVHYDRDALRFVIDSPETLGWLTPTEEVKKDDHDPTATELLDESHVTGYGGLR